MRVIFLMMIGMSLLQADFIKDGDTVKDTQSNLEWQDNEVGSKVKWQSAIKRCENLELAGHSDWRLPNINELKSIVDSSRYEPAIVEAFKNTRSYHYFSSTTFKSSKNGAWWNVYFLNGSIFLNDKDDNYYVRCVRGGN